jgi:protein required for attachment to host cells
MTQLHISKNALVIVGDGKKALFLRNRGTSREVELIVERQMQQENPPTREQGTDQPGRSHGVDGKSRTAIEQTDWHDRAEEHFAMEIAETLYQMEHAHEFDELVVVAPPKMLGDLRAALHPEVTQCIVAEVAKDLTAHPIPDLVRVLS